MTVYELLLRVITALGTVQAQDVPVIDQVIVEHVLAHELTNRPETHACEQEVISAARKAVKASRKASQVKK